MNVKEKVIEIISELTSSEVILPESSLQSDLGLNSLSMVTMMIAFEDAFEIEFDESDMNPYDLITVSDAVSLVEKYC